MTSFYLDDELKSIGFKSIGHDCLISRYARFYGAHNMTIGDYVRIDDFAILSGKISIGSHIHISAYVALYGSLGIEINDYSGISARSTIYSAMDDFSGEHLIGPMSPDSSTLVTGGPVILNRFVQIGAHCVVFPNVIVSEGTIVGACSLVKKSLKEWGIYAGIPAKLIKKRSKNLLGFIQD